MEFWVVRAGSSGEHEQEFLDQNKVAISFGISTDLSGKSFDEIKQIYAEEHGDKNKHRVGNRAGQLHKFVEKIKTGDMIAVPLKTLSSIMIGRVAGPYRYDGSKEDIKHERAVEWGPTFPRSRFDDDILNGFNAHLTVFQIKAEDVVARINAMDEGGKDPETGNGGQIRDDDDEKEDLEASSRDTIIRFLARNYTGHKLTWLIAEILRARGYTVRQADPGPDGGVDILASSGVVGMGGTKIGVQVKPLNSSVNRDVLNATLGAARKKGADYALLVAGGLTTAAMKDMDSMFFDAKLWDEGKVVDELIAVYDKLDDKIRASIPLRKMWAIVEE
ncbi:MAG: restriction endonuclease [Nitrosopumilus sp.]|nr:restriction endonuclease [Nitrosopumilus sp.]MDA7942614.1 restriction endonuclease [Nitrosopumilus sp.]